MYPNPKFYPGFQPNYQDNPFQEFNNVFWLQNVDIFDIITKKTQSKFHNQLYQLLDLTRYYIWDYNDLNFRDYVHMTRHIDLLCIAKTVPERKIQVYEECRAQAIQNIHKRVAIPYVNSMIQVLKGANQCLLDGKSLQQCSDELIQTQMYCNQVLIRKMTHIRDEFDLKVDDSWEKRLLFTDKY